MTTKRAERNVEFSAVGIGSGRATQTTAASENAGPNKGRFQPGQSGNPAGRPRGSKSKLSDDFWIDMHEAWQMGGKDAIAAMMREEPGRFIDCVARALPKDVNVRHEATDAFVNLWKLISDGTAEQAIAKARGEDTVGESDKAFLGSGPIKALRAWPFRDSRSLWRAR
jgi:hypothetical protein